MPTAITAGLGAAALAASLLGSASADTTIFVADFALMPDGSLMENAAIVVTDGRIERVMSADDIDGKSAIIRCGDGAVLCPGLIDVSSTLGVSGANTESTGSVDPNLSVVDGVDANSPRLREAIRAGVTSALIVPGSNNIIGGAAATIRMHPKDGAVEALRDNGPLALSFGPNVWEFSRGPTSRSGALHLLRQTLDAAKKSGGDGRVARLARGDLDAIIYCSEGEDVSSALRILAEYGLDASIVHTADAMEAAEELEGADVPVVVGPYSFSSDRRTLAGAGELADAGIDVAFRGGLPGREPASLRMTAALAVRYGMDAEAARRGLTATAAQIAGVGDRVGALKAGLDADLVVFSGDPLRLDSRVVEVWVGGERVYAAFAEDDE